MLLTRMSLLAGFLVVMTISVGEGMEAPGNKKEQVKTREIGLDAVLRSVAGKRIYFGHQSVGFNILDGMRDIMNAHPGSGLSLVKTQDPLAFKVPVLAHYTVGENEDPLSKINDFARAMDKGIGGHAEVAFFKFCYVDINRSTDIDKVFSAYRSTMARLKQAYPQTRFVHVTVPLTVTKSSVRSLIKKVMGVEDNNIKKNLFNEMLIREYGGIAPIFDLATLESTYSDGSRSTFTDGGKAYYSLVPEYTDDNGHLNENGRKVIAVAFLEFLSGVGP